MDPPVKFTPSAYLSWFQSIYAAEIPFYDAMSAWCEAQGVSRLSISVATDAQNPTLDVSRAIARTDVLENDSNIESGVAVGFDCCARVDIAIEKALEATLFFSSGPVGKSKGETCPANRLFGASDGAIQSMWGSGFAIFSGYLGPAPSLQTSTATQFNIFVLNPSTPDQIELRHSQRRARETSSRSGDTETARRNFGFDVSHIRDAEFDFIRL